MSKHERINDCQQSVMTNLKWCTETSSKFKLYLLISESKLRYEVIKEIVHPLKTYSINRSIHNFTQSYKFIWCYWNLKNFIQLNFIRSYIIKNLLDWFCYIIITLYGLDNTWAIFLSISSKCSILYNNGSCFATNCRSYTYTNDVVVLLVLWMYTRA